MALRRRYGSLHGWRPVPKPQHPCPQHCSAIKGKIATKQDKIPVDAALLLAYIELIERHNVFDQPVIKGTTR
ncbi:hypothetical protein [Caudoviricetes sp.]|nr:hypothetical protein [Caudoviricetes sp.]